MIKPTQSFVYVEFSPKDGSIFRPDGVAPNVAMDHCTVLELGPDVPKIPEIKVGDKVLLRGDTKAYGVTPTTACVDSRWIMAVIEEQPVPAELVALINQ